jgi:hypothetical protein
MRDDRKDKDERSFPALAGRAIPLLTTEGDTYTRGLTHDRRFAQEVADNVATYLRRFAASGLDRDAAFVEAARWRKATIFVELNRYLVDPLPTSNAHSACVTPKSCIV